MRFFATILMFLFVSGAFAEEPSQVGDLSLKAGAITKVDAAWTANLPRDPEAATGMYMQRIPPAARARSNSYFEGGYWLQLWNFLFNIALSAAFLSLGFSHRFRTSLERHFKSRFLQAVVFCGGFFIFSEIVSLPLGIYQGYFREHQYGLLNQGFGAWFGEQMTGFAVGLVFGSILLAVLYKVIQKVPRSWPIWGTLVLMTGMAFMVLISPVYIDPLFNKYKPLEDGVIRESILSMARQNGIPAKEVYEFDASKQSDRVSANVSGFLNTMSVRLNDNLLRRTTLPEIKAVMGHEMGHYVMNHIYKMMACFSIVIFLGFMFVSGGFEWTRKKFEQKWQVRSIDDIAGLPLLMSLLSVWMLLMTPVNNTIVRSQEAEADLFGLNTANEPDAEAEVDLKLTEYRKADPSPIEEFIFFDHPSTRNRVLMAMRWKAEKVTKSESVPKM